MIITTPQTTKGPASITGPGFRLRHLLSTSMFNDRLLHMEASRVLPAYEDGQKQGTAPATIKVGTFVSS